MTKESHSIRMAQETYDALAEYARKKAASLAEAIEALLNNVATSDVAKIAPERAAELETFERSLKTILDMYLHSITIKDAVAAQARESIKGELSEKDARICVLETELVEAREKSATLQRALDESESARTAAEARADRVDMSKLYVLMSEIKQGLAVPKKEQNKKAEHTECVEGKQLGITDIVVSNATDGEIEPSIEEVGSPVPLG